VIACAHGGRKTDNERTSGFQCSPALNAAGVCTKPEEQAQMFYRRGKTYTGARTLQGAHTWALAWQIQRLMFRTST